MPFGTSTEPSTNRTHPIPGPVEVPEIHGTVGLVGSAEWDRAPEEEEDRRTSLPRGEHQLTHFPAAQ